MEMIEAVIKPQRLDAVLAALAKIGVLGLTAFEVKGFGTQAGHTERYRGAKMDVGFVPKVMLQMVIKSSEREAVIEAITQAANTGQVGDGKIFVFPIGSAVRIRTGDTGQDAL